jgi:hypothetical protein
MTPRTEHPRPSPIRTWLGLRRSPLRRTSDHLEILARWVAVVMVVVGLFTSALVAKTFENKLADGSEQHLSPATATLTEDARAYPPLGMEPSVRSRTPATWSTPDGVEMRGLVTTTAGAQAGDKVDVLLRPDGAVAPTPPSPFERTVLSTIAGLAVPVLALVAGWLWLSLVRAALQRSRQRYWDAAWSAFDRAHHSGPRP